MGVATEDTIGERDFSMREGTKGVCAYGFAG